MGALHQRMKSTVVGYGISLAYDRVLMMLTRWIQQTSSVLLQDQRQVAMAAKIAWKAVCRGCWPRMMSAVEAGRAIHIARKLDGSVSERAKLMG
jgi:hypothetical protein